MLQALLCTFVLHVPAVMCGAGISKAQVLGCFYTCMGAAISFHGAALCCMLGTGSCCCILGMPPAMEGGPLNAGCSPQPPLRAYSTAGSSASRCRGFFYRITVIMGQEAIMRLTDARGYVVGTSQVST